MILCEYAHAMGNSFGGVGEYLDLAYRDPRFQGGFIWDFADQAIQLTDRHGQRYFGYGGDSGEAPHDADFCGNGILFADHTPTPKAQEVTKLYQGLHVQVEADAITVESRLLATRSSAYECRVTLEREGDVLETATLETDVAAGETPRYPLPVEMPARIRASTSCRCRSCCARRRRGRMPGTRSRGGRASSAPGASGSGRRRSRASGARHPQRRRAR